MPSKQETATCKSSGMCRNCYLCDPFAMQMLLICKDLITCFVVLLKALLHIVLRKRDEVLIYPCLQLWWDTTDIQICRLGCLRKAFVWSILTNCSEKIFFFRVYKKRKKRFLGELPTAFHFLYLGYITPHAFSKLLKPL